MKRDLVDTFWLLIYPVTLGVGKRLLAEGTILAAFKVTQSVVAPNGVVLLVYDRAGEIKLGKMEPIQIG